MQTTVVIAREGCDVYIGRATRTYAKASPTNPKPGRFGNPFKPDSEPGEREKELLSFLAKDKWTPPSVREAFTHRIKNGGKFHSALMRAKDCIEAYDVYARCRASIDRDWATDVLNLSGKRLGCFCSSPQKPGPCHGHPLGKLADELRAGTFTY